jgi:thiamine-monophosphate kinase
LNLHEFTLIERYFAPLAGEAGLGLADDAAVFTPPQGRQLVVAVDALVAGVHFLPDDPPDTIGRKLLRVNLSDLAAMGATPLSYLLTLSAPRDTPEGWFAAFAAGLAADQAEYNIALIGGDTTSTPGPLSLTATVIGHVAPGQALRRNGAHPGDGIWVTGTIGDGALGLLALRQQLPDPDGYLADRYRLPRPRLGLPLGGIASAAMDVSDGLIQDIGHICTASCLGADIDAALVPRSRQAKRTGPTYLETCLTGGDDYELALAVPDSRAPDLQAACAMHDVPVTRIGRFVTGDVAVRVTAGGVPMPIAHPGWSHF